MSHPGTNDQYQVAAPYQAEYSPVYEMQHSIAEKQASEGPRERTEVQELPASHTR